VRRVGSVDYYNGAQGFYAMFDVGATRNLSQNYAVGLDLYLGADDDLARFGVKARGRRWLGAKVAIDIAPGILLAGSDDSRWEPNFPGFVGELSVTYDGWLGLVGGVETVPLEYQTTFPKIYPSLLKGTDTSWYVGGKLSGGPGLGLTIAGLLLVALIATTTEVLVY
jgi:hypothetical protein